MNEKLIAILSLPANATEQNIIDGVAALKKQAEDLKIQKQQAAADEELIAEKMLKGLSREQAIIVITKNRDHREQRFAQIGDAKKIKELFPDATDSEITKATANK